ncbi:NADH-quinone oxidoreductase subunit H [Candidatus Micrarchaeota archaeon]|nr:NADH-quinone oxidoreductase subunit H [Candidatus Micrarchaeota archaeon]MBU1165486.1 NADH-quinone oxidoreductase subunit H [Candidatus Micrarchaeota archaeon]MBU1886324.1 NADH-quinone oxidoreductase subunit H [Candidatus Micrarchaeota archaeon]
MIEILYALLLIPGAIIIEGLRRKTVARMHNRAGPPLLQPFYDILKLLGKEKFIYENAIFSLVPYLALFCSFFMLLIFPFSVIGFDFDFLVLGYVFILQDTIYIFGALASRSPFGMYASVRELLLMLGYEITFIIVLCLFFYNAGVYSFQNYDVEFAFAKIPIVALLAIFTAFVILRITPYDVMNAEAEIGAGFFSEYSGTPLAILDIAELIKNLMTYILLGFLIFGKTYALIMAPIFMIFYAIMLTSSARYSTLVTAKTFIILAILAFVHLIISGSLAV